ncbi:acyl carrier protein [Actinomadura sp. KC06]|uniref:acyl carrier protein n=1 Tax=Actinomadura sp. KC06 TaxID=2530369 RepID=UPI00104391C3|nr:acyl carrier protein [Actinomadura sp. KC06]TDD37553.1 acyl carrier protein [Actinomadura sp. KC06]
MAAETNHLPLLATVVEEVTGVPAAEVRSDCDLIEDLGLDSLSVVEVVFETQKRLATEIPDEGLAGVRTVHDLLQVVDLAVNGSATP